MDNKTPTMTDEITELLDLAGADAAAARQKELDWQKEKLIEYLKIVKEPTKEI